MSFIATFIRNTANSFITPFVQDERPFSIRFIEEFESQYGETHPQWTNMSFFEALNLARSTNKLLFIYLHCENHDETSPFCHNTLCTNIVTEFINTNFVSWAGSIFHSEAFQISTLIGCKKYPFCAILHVNSTTGRNFNTLVRHEGLIGPDQLIASLAMSLDSSAALVAHNQHSLDEATQTRRLRQQQETEYFEALATDTAREQQELQEAQKKKTELEEIEKTNQKKAEEAKQKEELRLAKGLSLPSEPDIGTSNTTTVRIRLPNGKFLQRRFHTNVKMKVLFDFIDSQFSCDEEYLLVRNLPKQIYSDPTISLQEAGFETRMQLFIQEK